MTGYTEVVRNVQKTGIPLDSFTFSMKDRRLFRKQCCIYLESLGVNEQTGGKADEILASSRKAGRMTIMLVGRPYHSDPPYSIMWQR